MTLRLSKVIERLDLSTGKAEHLIWLQSSTHLALYLRTEHRDLLPTMVNLVPELVELILRIEVLLPHFPASLASDSLWQATPQHQNIKSTRRRSYLSKTGIDLTLKNPRCCKQAASVRRFK
jgi:hypothetical protein